VEHRLRRRSAGNVHQIDLACSALPSHTAGAIQGHRRCRLFGSERRRSADRRGGRLWPDRLSIEGAEREIAANLMFNNGSEGSCFPHGDHAIVSAGASGDVNATGERIVLSGDEACCVYQSETAGSFVGRARCPDGASRNAGRELAKSGSGPRRQPQLSETLLVSTAGLARRRHGRCRTRHSIPQTVARPPSLAWWLPAARGAAVSGPHVPRQRQSPTLAPTQAQSSADRGRRTSSATCPGTPQPGPTRRRGPDRLRTACCRP